MIDQGAADVSYVILTGGRSSRFGTDKAQAEINSVSLMDRLLDTLPVVSSVSSVSSVPSVPSVRVVIGPEIQGGPAAAVDAGIAAISTRWVAVVAVDMPFASPVIAYLVQLALGIKADGLIPIDAGGKEQWLCALYQVAPLRAAVAAFGSVAGAPLHKVLAPLNLHRVHLPGELARLLIDIDTPADLARAQLLDQTKGVSR
jgi:molybdopterin-guanine dinucleotide biosynthesis protein A